MADRDCLSCDKSHSVTDPCVGLNCSRAYAAKMRFVSSLDSDRFGAALLKLVAAECPHYRRTAEVEAA